MNNSREKDHNKVKLYAFYPIISIIYQSHTSLIIRTEQNNSFIHQGIQTIIQHRGHTTEKLPQFKLI